MGMRLGWNENEATMTFEWDYSGLGMRNKRLLLMLNDLLISALLRKHLIFHWMQIFWMSTKEHTVLCSYLI